MTIPDHSALPKPPSKAGSPAESNAAKAPDTRERILEAALREFSVKGLAGSRTDAIAAAAGVNKALIYYYFDSKDKLYLAAVELVLARVWEHAMAVLRRDASPGELLVRAALNHFDRILTQREFQSLMQQEMIRMHRGEQAALELLVDRFFRPLHEAFATLVRKGIDCGELIDVDQIQILFAGLGANVFYFLSAPVWQMLLDFDPISPDALRARRVALVRFLGQAVFTDRRHGAEVAERVLADMPPPPIVDSGHLKGCRIKPRAEETGE